jgi:hypothetical protein
MGDRVPETWEAAQLRDLSISAQFSTRSIPRCSPGKASPSFRKEVRSAWSTRTPPLHTPSLPSSRFHQSWPNRDPDSSRSRLPERQYDARFVGFERFTPRRCAWEHARGAGPPPGGRAMHGMHSVSMYCTRHGWQMVAIPRLRRVRAFDPPKIRTGTPTPRKAAWACQRKR